MKTVITGANRGIGAAMLTRLRQRGDEVIGTSRKPAGDLVICDVARPETLGALAAAVGEGPLDLLVCNAGVYLDGGQRLEDGYPAQMWADTFAVNVTGVFATIQTVLPALRRARGRIAIISSMMGSDEMAQGGGSYIYRASKAAALNLGRNLAADLRGDGIAVGIYHPGWVQTDMGGAQAEVPVDRSAEGLVQRFDALNLDRSGCFETWDGQTLPF